MRVADIILQQIGGKRFIMMTGSKNFLSDGNALMMHLTTNKVKAKYLRIELMGDDTYTMTFRKRANKDLECPIVKQIEGVYCDQLEEIFTDVTGLYTRL